MSATDPCDWSDDKLLRLRAAATELLADWAPFAHDDAIRARLALIDAEVTRRDLHAAVAGLRADFLPHVVLHVVVDGDLDRSEVFFDDLLFREALRGVADDAVSHGYRTEVYIGTDGSVPREPLHTFN